MQRCTELNVTNRSRAYPERHRKEIQKGVDSFQYSVLREHSQVMPELLRMQNVLKVVCEAEHFPR